MIFPGWKTTGQLKNCPVVFQHLISLSIPEDYGVGVELGMVVGGKFGVNVRLGAMVGATRI